MEADDPTTLGLELALDGCPLTSVTAVASVSHTWRRTALEALEHRRTLDLTPFRLTITDEYLTALVARMPEVRHVNISGCSKLGDASLTALKSCRHLTELNLSCLTQIHADFVADVVDTIGDTLSSLELAGCRSISEYELVSRFGRFLELDDDEDGLSKVQG